MSAAVQSVDEWLEVNPGDLRHLFYEQMKNVFFALRDINPDDIDDEALDLITRRADQLMEAIFLIQRRRKQKGRPASQLHI